MFQSVWIKLTLLLSLCQQVTTLDNGLARTPPMGWLSWLRFGCNTDCRSSPLSCIGERLVMDMADRMLADGFKDAGYEYVNLDDCWLATQRDAQGKLQPDPDRFPNGLKRLADYVHSKGLKIGIYEDYGTKTCAGYPGSLGFVEQDAQTFAEWGIDYVKFDACNIAHDAIDVGYPQMSEALNSTKRPMIYSCEWAFYTQFYQQKKPDYPTIRKFCNVWRVFDDIGIDWPSILRTIHYFDANQDDLIAANGPGGWNDPDMLAIGNPGMSVNQAKVQFGLWAIWSAPLLMSNDLRFIAPAFRDILLNRKVIAVNQDPLGIMGRLTINTTYVALYVKALTPLKQDTNDTSFAVAFFNRSPDKTVEIFLTSMSSIGLKHVQGYLVEELFTDKPYGTWLPNSSFVTTLAPTSILLFKATVI